MWRNLYKSAGNLRRTHLAKPIQHLFKDKNNKQKKNPPSKVNSAAQLKRICFPLRRKLVSFPKA